MTGMPDGLVTVVGEVYPVAVARVPRRFGLFPKQTQLWLVGEGPWQTHPLGVYEDIQTELRTMLHERGVPKECLILMHSTSAAATWASWHPDDTSMVHTFVAPVAAPHGKHPKEMWPAAQPVTKELFREWSQPRSYALTE